MEFRAGWRAWRSFRGAPWNIRLFLGARLLVAAAGSVAEEVGRTHGSVLSLGCGYGIVERMIAQLHPHLMIEGFELDRTRVELAAHSQRRAPRVSVREADAAAVVTDATYEQTLAIDLFHHLRPFQQREAARVLADGLEPGGVCIVKDIATSPAWKHRWNRLHDRLVAGPAPTYCLAPVEMARLLEDAGLSTERVSRLAPLSPYPHYMVVARKPNRRL